MYMYYLTDQNLWVPAMLYFKASKNLLNNALVEYINN